MITIESDVPIDGFGLDTIVTINGVSHKIIRISNGYWWGFKGWRYRLCKEA